MAESVDVQSMELKNEIKQMSVGYYLTLVPNLVFRCLKDYNQVLFI